MTERGVSLDSLVSDTMTGFAVGPILGGALCQFNGLEIDVLVLGDPVRALSYNFPGRLLRYWLARRRKRLYIPTMGETIRPQ